MSSCLRVQIDARVRVVASVILVVSLTLGLTLDANANIPEPWNRVSSIIGWVYFSCWSVGFYPQLFSNYYRKSVSGLSLDSIVLSLLGFVCYAIFNCAFFYSERVQEQYMRLHDGHRSAVEVNDVFFSLNATVLVGTLLFQCAIYSNNGGENVSKATLTLTAAVLAVAALFAAAVVLTGNDDGANESSSSLFTTLNLLYYLSYVKLALTLVKYIPQVLLNYQRKSTAGWTIWGVYFDMIGGVLSIAQQVLDSAATHDWSAITGDPVKFSLALVTILMDIKFFLQHYVWYAVLPGAAADGGHSNNTSSTSSSSSSKHSHVIELSEKQRLLS
ncbi:hypothetical protein Gpo141_00004085 [Globisporangium polare]